MEVPYANLKRIYDNSKKELDKAVQDCIDNSWFIKGPKVSEFEDNFDVNQVIARNKKSGSKLEEK